MKSFNKQDALRTSIRGALSAMADNVKGISLGTLATTAFVATPAYLCKVGRPLAAVVAAAVQVPALALLLQVESRYEDEKRRKYNENIQSANRTIKDLRVRAASISSPDSDLSTEPKRINDLRRDSEMFIRQATALGLLNDDGESGVREFVQEAIEVAEARRRREGSGTSWTH